VRLAVGPVTDAGELQVHVRAAPAGGAANEQLLRLLVDELGVPRSAVGIERGAAGRRKTIVVDGVDPAALRQRWPGLAVGRPPDDRNRVSGR
jgi:uncharacterized protein YggU (UPF0235/DUF167 family)